MSRHLIWRYLQDRTGLVIAFYVAVGLVLALTGLLMAQQGLSTAELWANVGYAFLLASTVLLIFLGLEYFHWAPFAAQVIALKEGSGGLDSIANLPPPQTMEQADYRDLIDSLYGRAVAEINRYTEAHQRHLTFINMWVHQMKTPVSAIHLIAQRAPEKDREALQADLESVAEEASRLAEGLELVLNMARLTDFAPDYRIERVDLLEAVRGAVNARKRTFIRVRIFPEVEAEPGPLPVLTDRKWHGFVLDQIISNALKYGAQGGPEGQKLLLRIRREGAGAVLTIADQGPGIPEEDLPRLYEPFFTGANGRRFVDATGIGLFLVRQVVDRLGHEIRIDSRLGEGTTVTLRYR